MAMKAESLARLSGEVEADETFVGGRHGRKLITVPMGWRRLKHAPATGKTTVFGLVQRGG